MVECHWKSTFGIECTGCGFQRSIDLILQGKLIESIGLYPATLPFFATLIYTLVHLKFNFSNGARNIVILFSFTALLMLLNFFLKSPFI